MKLKSLLILILVITACGSPDDIPPQYPASYFFKDFEAKNFSLSPSGKYVACLKPYKNKFNLVVNDYNSNSEQWLTTCENNDISYYKWIEDDRLIYIKYNVEKSDFELNIINADSSNFKTLLSNKGKIKVIGINKADNNKLFIGLNVRNPKLTDVYELNLVTGNFEMVLKNPGNYVDFMADNRGYINSVIAVRGTGMAVLHRDSLEDEFESTLIAEYGDDIFLVNTSNENNLFLLSNVGRDKIALIEYDPANAKEVGTLYENDQVDVDKAYYSWQEKRIAGVSVIKEKKEFIYFNRSWERSYEELREELGGDIEILDVNNEEDLFLFAHISDVHPPVYYLHELNTNRTIKVGVSAPWINSDHLSTMEPIEYQASDGTTIHGYLVLPKGRKAKSLPAIIMPHGGPWKRDVWGFNAEAQFFANRGYAVLMMNYRGSKGYGKEFLMMGNRNWGTEIQEDISDGVRWLIEQNIIHKQKISILGKSFGGYCALMNSARNPELYSCAISQGGLIDLISFLESVPPSWEPFRKILAEMIGDPLKDKELLMKASPIYNAEKIDIPVLLAYGKKDYLIKYIDVKKMIATLQEQNSKVEFIIEENEGHVFKSESSVLNFYEKANEFIETNLFANRRY